MRTGRMFMDILKCEAFIRAVEAGSFSAAAEKWEYTPSGVTRMVNALEVELGFALLARTRKGVALTSNGERMLPVLRELVRWNEQAFQLSAEIQGLAVGNLTIGTYYSVASCWLPKVIKQFEEGYPAIRMNIQEAGNVQLMAMLEEHRIDCCFLSDSVCPKAEWIPLREDRMVVWLPKNHPKAGLGEFPLEDINGAPFIHAMPGRCTDVDLLLERDRLTPDIRFTTIDDATAFAMVEAGLGISMDNELSTQRMKGDVVTLPFTPPRTITIGIAVPSLANASPATKKFIACAKRMLL